MKDFIKAALIRAIRTVCQAALATIGAAFVLSDVNWAMVISASILAGIISILTSVATGLPEVDLTYKLDDFYDDESEEEEDGDDY